MGASVGVRVMESIERLLRLHRDPERPVGVGFEYLDPQQRRSLPPEEPHPRPVRRALGQLKGGWTEVVFVIHIASFRPRIPTHRDRRLTDYP